VGEVIDIFPADSEEQALRLEMFDDEIEAIYWFDPLTGEKLKLLHSLNFNGRLSSAEGSLKPKSTSVVLRALSPLYIPPIWLALTCITTNNGISTNTLCDA
jgi:hypothetical protein